MAIDQVLYGGGLILVLAAGSQVLASPLQIPALDHLAAGRLHCKCACADLRQACLGTPRAPFFFLIIEFVGTVVLVTVAAGSGAINHYAGGGPISRTAAAITPGAVVMAMI
jgi:hypothetical protein